MTATIPMIRADDGKTADVHADEVENWQPFGWTIDEARARAQVEESERIKREAEEATRAEAERRAAEEEALRKAGEEEAERQNATAAAQQSSEAGVPVAAAPPQAGEGQAPAQSGEAGSGETTAAPGQPIAGDEAAPGEAQGNGTANMSVGKGPRGLFFLKAGDIIVSKGFPTEEEANAALAELSAGGAQ